MKPGKIVTLTMKRRAAAGMYLTDEREEVLLPNKYVPENAAEGNSIEVFLYTDSSDRLVATTRKPVFTLGQVAVLPIKEVTTHGAFADWGLEKDLLIPFKEQQVQLKQGDEVPVKLCYDRSSGRLYGSTSLQESEESEGERYTQGQEVNLFIVDESPLGFIALINSKTQGLIYHNEVFRSLNIGDITKGYIKNVREDGKIDVSLQKSGVGNLHDSAEQLLEKLREKRGFLSLHDGSTPEEIKFLLGMSKKSFKRAAGILLKKGMITLESEGIRLNDQEGGK